MNVRIARWLFLAVFGFASISMVVPGAFAQNDAVRQRVGPGFAAHRSPFEQAFHFGGRFWNNPRIAAALKITPDQQKEMDSILFEHREKLIDLRANLQKSELEMEPLMNADEPNRAAVEAQIDKVVAARAALEKANSNFLLDIRMKLTPGQWEQIKNFRAEGGMRERHRNWGPNGRMRMRGPNGPQGEPTPQSKPTPQPSPSGNNPEPGAGPPQQ